MFCALTWFIRQLFFFAYPFISFSFTRGFEAATLRLNRGGCWGKGVNVLISYTLSCCAWSSHHPAVVVSAPIAAAAGWGTQSQLLPISPASLVSHSKSTWSNPFSTLQSTSMTPTTAFASLCFPSSGPIRKIGITISLRLSASQAICPGKACVSGITKGRPDENAVPQTPWPGRIDWHAGFPWKGARMRL